MYVVGSDRIRVTAAGVEPDGIRHAVDEDRQVSCRDRGTGFTFPALGWRLTDDVEDCCSECIRVVLSRQAPSPVDTYPSFDAAFDAVFDAAFDSGPDASFEAAEQLIPDSLGF